MKKFTLLSLAALVCAFSSSSAFCSTRKTETICGTLGTYSWAPTCAPGKACPHFMVLRYEILEDSGDKVTLETASDAVLTQFNEFNKQPVCAVGSPSKNAFEVTEIYERN